MQTLRPAVILWASRQNGAGMPVQAFPPAEGTRVAPDGYAPAGNAETAQIPAVSAPLPERTGGKSLSGRGKTRPARRQSVRRGDPAGNLPDVPPPAPDTAHSGAEQAGIPFLYVMLWRGVRPRVTARHRRGTAQGVVPAPSCRTPLRPGSGYCRLCLPLPFRLLRNRGSPPRRYAPAAPCRPAEPYPNTNIPYIIHPPRRSVNRQFPAHGGAGKSLCNPAVRRPASARDSGIFPRPATESDAAG